MSGSSSSLLSLLSRLGRAVVTDGSFALRLLRRSPGFSATVLVVLSLGIGVMTAMFSLVVALVVRPLPYPQPEELTVLSTTDPPVDPRATNTSIPDFVDWRDGNTTFRAIAAVDATAFNLSVDAAHARAEHLRGANVSGDFFTVYGVAPLIGRFLTPEDDRVGAPRVVVLSAAVWRAQFGADPGLVGRTVTLNGDLFTVIGIAPDGFRVSGPRYPPCDAWTPIAVNRPGFAWEASEEARTHHFVNVVGRRKSGVSIAAAQADLDRVALAIRDKHPRSNGNIGVALRDLKDAIVGTSRDTAFALFGAVSLVFLVVCANVANLLLARVATRRSEMAARAALGATTGRLRLQGVIETGVLFGLGSIGGVLVAHGLVAPIASGVVRGAAASAIAIQVDGPALAFAIGVALLGGVVFGLAPAGEAARSSPQAVLKLGGPRTSLGRGARVLRGALIVAQVAIAVTLLTGSGLALRAYARTVAVPPGFDPDNVVVAKVVLPEKKYEDRKTRLAFYRDALERLAAEPGVVSVGGSNVIPMSGTHHLGRVAIEGQDAEPLFDGRSVTPGWFRTMGIPILRGRDIGPGDVEESRDVVLINQEAADRFFRGQDPIGHRIGLGTSTPGGRQWYEIVGVVGNVRANGPREPVPYETYFAFAQAPVGGMNFTIRTGGPQENARILKELPRVIATVDPELAVASRDALADRVSAVVGPQRFMTQLLVGFAAIALVLAAFGIFGLVSYTTSQRTRELGIRLALGSSPERIVGIVMREGVSLLGFGLVLGLVLVAVSGHAIASRITGAEPSDPVVVAAICAILASVGAVASLIPALRAIRIPPAVALRHES